MSAQELVEETIRLEARIAELERSLSDSIKSRDAYWQERFSDALQSDLEHGVQALSAHAAIQFNTTYPALLATLVALREATE